jgi:hypothetical protein
MRAGDVEFAPVTFITGDKVLLSPINRLPSPVVNKYLSSWKEIAQYFNRGVRTVQRWEAELGMPVRRPHGGSRTAVMAIREELDSWMASRPFRGASLSHEADEINGINDDHESDLVHILMVEDGTGDGQPNVCFMKKLGTHLKLDTVSNLDSALSLLKEIDDGKRPQPDLIILDQVLFGTVAHKVFRLCQENSRLKNVQILVRPSIFTQKGMLAA